MMTKNSSRFSNFFKMKGEKNSVYDVFLRCGESESTPFSYF